MPTIKSTTITKTTRSMCFTQAELLEALSHYRIPKTAKVTITVPRGGDYSGQTIDTDECGGVFVCWTEVEEAAG